MTPSALKDPASAASGRPRVAVDIGGTFTDAVRIDGDGVLTMTKCLTIKGQQDSSVLQATERLGVQLDAVADFVHGTTTGLNMLLERRGARVALITTKGFKDVYEIGRANRPEMYNIHYQRPPRLLGRRDVFEVDERVAADGEVVRELDRLALSELARSLGADYDSVAVCFLHAYRWPAHEVEAAEILRELAPGLVVLTSHDVAAEWREFERFSTAVVSSYITPGILDYLARLEGRLASEGLATPLKVMQSNGGVMSARAASLSAIQTLYSGPVGGTVAGAMIGRQLAIDHLICVDMGGTSFDVSLVVDGEVDIESQIEVIGHPVLAPAVAMHSLGAGGGSVIHLESGGLRVGPESAGGDPGPASYGRGGTLPTITDANLVLGRISTDAVLGGVLALDLAAATSALGPVATALGIDEEKLALGAVAVVDAMMADGVREVTVGRGIDPRDFTLLAFGGAGPLHAAEIAMELDIDRVVVPFAPGVLSAWGMLQADVRHDVVQSCLADLATVDVNDVEADLAPLRSRARATLIEEGLVAEAILLEEALDLRYRGQEYTLSIPSPWPFDDAARNFVLQRFHAAYLERYGHNNVAESVELVSVRVNAVGRSVMPARVLTRVGGDLKARTTVRTVFSSGAFSSQVFERDDLGPGALLSGPCIVEEQGCTTLVPPGWSASVVEGGHLVLERASL